MLRILNYRRRATFIATALLPALAVAAQGSAAEPLLSVAGIQDPLASPLVLDGESGEVLDSYYSSILQWGRIVEGRVVPVPQQPSNLYIGRPGNRENDIRSTAYSAMVLAFLAEAHPPTSLLKDEDRNAMREKAVGLLRYLLSSHKANDGTCADGTEWGEQWQSALWSRAVGFAAWQLWPSLDNTLRQQSQAVIAFEADRFITKPPKSSLRNDTGAEENAWNGSICSLASCMIPEHPNAQEWDQAAKRYMYNTFSVADDADDATVGDDGKPIAEWVTTINAHPDFTVENHQLVHVGYLKNSACLLQENATHWMLVGKPVPAACNHHIPEVFRVLASCMNWKGSAIYFAGNDWRLYETQCSDILLYSILARAGDSREAAYLERTAPDRLVQQQQSEGGFYNGRRDLEYSGLCATRLIGCYLAHATASEPMRPATESEFDQFAGGVRQLAAAKTILHRTPEKFASFTWAQQRMALTQAKKESVVWPHYFSYLGVVDRKGPAERDAPLEYLEVEEQSNSFQVTGSLRRTGGKVMHDFFFCSPESSYTVYVERLRVGAGHQVNRRWTGLIGVQAPMGESEVSLATAEGVLMLRGKGGKKQNHRLVTDWLNVGEAIGYVVKRSSGVPNEMFVRDNIKVQPRRPHLHEWVGLVANDEPLEAESKDWACIVALPNADAEQTRTACEDVDFRIDGNTATVTFRGDRYDIDFSDRTP